MADRELLDDAIKALGEAASEEEPIRFGHDVARLLHGALVEATIGSPNGDAPSHEHAWTTLGWDRAGWDRPGGARALVVQVCECGLARELVATVVPPAEASP
jgi:hypothetical protein